MDTLFQWKNLCKGPMPGKRSSLSRCPDVVQCGSGISGIPITYKLQSAQISPEASQPLQTAWSHSPVLTCWSPMPTGWCLEVGTSEDFRVMVAIAPRWKRLVSLSKVPREAPQTFWDTPEHGHLWTRKWSFPIYQQPNTWILNFLHSRSVSVTSLWWEAVSCVECCYYSPRRLRHLCRVVGSVRPDMPDDAALHGTLPF